MERAGFPMDWRKMLHDFWMQQSTIPPRKTRKASTANSLYKPSSLPNTLIICTGNTSKHISDTRPTLNSAAIMVLKISFTLRHNPAP